jgi:hypothetical protein
MSDGWESLGSTVTFESSTDRPVYDLFVEGDVTNDLWKGLFFKATNENAVKKGIIHDVYYDSEEDKTKIKIFGGTNFKFTNSAITDPFVSYQRSPKGFPLHPDLWGISTMIHNQSEDTNITSPTQNVWYPVLSIDLKPGLWDLSYSYYGKVDSNGTADVLYATISDYIDSVSDPLMSSNIVFAIYNGTARQCLKWGRVVEINESVTKYLLLKTNQSGQVSIGMVTSLVPTIITARSAYL